jgi:hypothetical protein
MSENDVDILSIDEKLLKKFDSENDSLQTLKSRLDDLKKSESFSLSLKHRNDLEKAIKELENDIERIESERDRNFYISESAELLEQYRKILKTPLKLSFTGRPVQCVSEKISIVNKYIEIAEKYMPCVRPISIKKRASKMSCENCPNKREFIIDDNACICSDCGAEQNILQHTTSYKDVDRVNISTKYSYDRKVHFRDCINQYQGKQNCTIDQKIYDDLEEMFEKHHLLVGGKSTKKEIRFSKITREHVLMFLKELGFSKHYENVILIHYNMTGKKPDDISHLEDKLLTDFDLLVETYDKHFKNKVDRVNFISTQYVLYQLLLKHKHPCRKEDFVILKTVDRKSFHDTICSQLFGLLSWSFINPLY